MQMFQRLIWAALAVALLVGTVQTALQQAWAVPLILRAEAFEDRKAVPDAQVQHGHAHEDGHAHEHAHDGTAWAPQDGAERTFWTWVANVLHGFGLALLALASLAARAAQRGRATARRALALGVAAAGFVSLHLWPSLGLPAELPGLDAARLGSRQGWWLLAAGSAAAACALLAFGRGSWRWAVAAAWLALPFAVGAPRLDGDPLASFGPEAQAALRELEGRFVMVTHAIAASLWLSMGAACAWAFVRWVQPLLAEAGLSNHDAALPVARHGA